MFINKPRNSIKLLVWDRNGLVIYYMRLEEGAFEVPGTDEKSMAIKWEELVMMLEGIALKSVKRRKQYSIPQEWKTNKFLLANKCLKPCTGNGLVLFLHHATGNIGNES